MIGLFGTFEFIGCSLACLIFPPLADTYGRKIFTTIAMWVSLIVFTVLILTANMYVYYGTLLLNGVLIGLKQFIVYTHVMEFMSTHTNFVSGLFFFVDGGVFTVSPLILYFIVQNTQVLVYIALTLSIATLGFTLKWFYIPESLKFTLTKGRYE
jgi:MFS family permease